MKHSHGISRMKSGLWVILFSVFLLANLLIALSAHAQQGISDEDIKRTADMMRAAGKSEADVQKIIDNMKIAQGFSQAMEKEQAGGLDEMTTARKAAGFSNSDMANMKNFESDLSALNAQVEAQNLQKAIAQFRADHGSKPDAVITIDGTRHVFKVLKCDRRDDLFFIDAEGEPTQSRHRGPTLSVRRSSAYGQGGYLDSITFRSGDNSVGLTGRNGKFVGDGFEFEGQATASNINSMEKTSVSLKLNVACGS